MDSASHLSKTELDSKVNDILVRLFEVEEKMLKPEHHLFTDLGLDSLDAIDMVVAFQKEFKIKPTSEEMQKILTLGDVYTLVQNYYTKIH